MTLSDFEELNNLIPFEQKNNGEIQRLLENAVYTLVLDDDIIGFTTCDNVDKTFTMQNPWNKKDILYVQDFDEVNDRILFELR